jgi:thiol-disulfide isomerase/thioredoxin
LSWPDAQARSLYLMISAAACFWSAPASALELVMFDAPWCGHCRAFKRDVLPWYGSSKVGRVIPLRVASMGHPVWFRLSSPIHGVPTFILVDGGREVRRFYGYSDPRAFLERLVMHAQSYVRR